VGWPERGGAAVAEVEMAAELPAREKWGRSSVGERERVRARERGEPGSRGQDGRVGYRRQRGRATWPARQARGVGILKREAGG